MNQIKKTRNKLLSVLLAVLLIAQTLGGVLFMPPIRESLADAPDQTIFSENFETGTGKWVVNGNFTVSDTIAHDGSYSLVLDTVGDVYKKFDLTDMNSPNRSVVFYWYPQSTESPFFSPILSLEEGSWSSTNKAIEMFWDDTQVYFNLYRYRDGERRLTTTSSIVSITNNSWHKIEIVSNTTLTQIKIDDTPVQFGGSDSSSILTNTFNWIRFLTSPSIVIKDDDGDCNDSTFAISGSTTRHKKELLVSGVSSILSAAIKIYLDKDDTLVGDLVVDINGQRALNLSNDDINPGSSNPPNRWYSFEIDKSLLVEGTNDIVMYSEGGATNTALRIDTDASTNRSATSTDGGTTWDYDNLRSGVDGEFMVRLDLTVRAPDFYVDDITVAKENIVDTSDLFSRTFDEISSGIIPSGNDKIQAIYAYLLTRDNTYLTQAETGADSIQTAYDNGDKNLFYVKEMALLATFDSDRIGLIT